MKDQLRKAMLIGLGLAVVTKEKTEKVAKELMKKGQINEKDAKALVNKVAKEIDKTRAKIENEVRREIDRMAKDQKKKRKR
jgi:polyhydroxyalkanoate synthesis regulator phasin